MKLFSTEQVSKYHPDKYADQISDAVLDACLKADRNSRVACEALVKGTTVVLAGEITSKATDDEITKAVMGVGRKLGYEIKETINLLTKQSPEIAGAVNAGSIEDPGAGDQGIMFGYATAESGSLLPWGFDLANRVISIIEDDVEYNPKTILKGDAKTQVTVDLEKNPEDSLHTLLVSACHKEGYTLGYVKAYIFHLLEANGIPKPSHRLLINPAGEWTIGGPTADAGLTGRKIVCDQYGGYMKVGGGAFSGKDPSKVDRSASYIARHIAEEAIRTFPAVQWMEIQLAYAIAVKAPVSVAFQCNLEDEDELQEIQAWINDFDLTPGGIIKQLKLLDNPNYEKRAEGCHYYQHLPRSKR